MSALSSQYEKKNSKSSERMAMKKFLLGFIKLTAACSGPAAMLYSEKLFEEYFETGKQTSDELYSVLINNHGVYRYITESQNQDFRIFLGLAVLWVVGLFITIITTKSRK